MNECQDISSISGFSYILTLFDSNSGINSLNGNILNINQTGMTLSTMPFEAVYSIKFPDQNYIGTYNLLLKSEVFS